MAVAFASFTGHGDTNPTTACTVTLPATAANDILILQVINGGANAALTPGGTYNGSAWAAIGTNAGWTSGWGGLWWSRCTGNHATQTVAFTGATDSISAAVTLVTGAITTGNPYDTNISEETEAAGANVSLAAFDTTVANTLVFFTWSIDDNLLVSSPTKGGSAMGNLSSKVSSGGADSGVGNASLAQAGTGTTGAFAGTLTAGTNQGKLLKGFALKPVASAAHTQPVDDTAAGTDARASAVGRTQVDTIAGTDAQSHAWSAVRPLTETPSATDALTQTVTKPVADSATLTDSITPLLILTQRIDDEIAGTDSTVTATGKGVADTAQGVDAIVKAPTHVLTDAFAGTDAQARAWAALMSLADNGNWTDAAQPVGSGGASWAQTINDSAAMADAVLATVAYLRTVSDVAAGTDAINAGLVAPATYWSNDTETGWLGGTHAGWFSDSEANWPQGEE